MVSSLEIGSETEDDKSDHEKQIALGTTLRMTVVAEGDSRGDSTETGAKGRLELLSFGKPHSSLRNFNRAFGLDSSHRSPASRPMQSASTASILSWLMESQLSGNCPALAMK